MGSPQSRRPRNTRRLEKASELAMLPGPIRRQISRTAVRSIRFTLPRQGVSLLVLEW